MAQHGFTLIELMWAVFILLIIMGAVAAGLSSTLNLSRNNTNRVVAANIGSQAIDKIRQQASTSFNSLTINHSEQDVLVEGIKYTVKTDADWIPKDADSNPCDSTSDNPIAYVRFTTKVYWPEMNGVTPPTAATIVTPPVKTFASGKGNVGVKVIGASNQPQENMLVTLAGPGGTPTYSKTTSSAGCAFFAQVTPLATDQYTVTLNEPGYVDPDGNQLVSKAATVIAGETADPLGFKYDLAASLTVTLEGSPSGGPTAALPTSPLALTLRNSELTTIKKTFAAPATNAAAQTITGLFPFPGTPYTGWPGGCEDSDPEGQRPDESRYFDIGERVAGALLTPGGTADFTVPMQTIEFTVYEDDTDPANRRSGETILAEHVTTTGECPAPWTITLGQTDSSGQLLVALPYGNFTFKVQGRTPKTSWLTAVSTPPADAIPSLALVYD